MRGSLHQLLRKRALFLSRQEDASSLRLLSVESSGPQMIRNFFLRNFLIIHVYGGRDFFPRL